MQAFSSYTHNAAYTADMSTPLGRPAKRERTAFGERLASAREAAGLSQTELAAKLGVSHYVLSWWERRPVALRPDQIVALTTALGVSADVLFGIAPEPPKAAPGPVGKARKVFEEVSALPRRQQDKIIGVVETLIAGTAKAA